MTEADVPFARIVTALEPEMFERYHRFGGGKFGAQLVTNGVSGLFAILKERAELGSVDQEDAIASGELLLDILRRAEDLRRAEFVEKKATDRELSWAVYQKTKGHCVYCGVFMDPFDRSGGIGFHVDHAVSRLNGGTNDLSNLVPSCAVCNITKGGQNADEFLSRGEGKP
jgi:hypothetical protein